jgi:hypothetical protein
MAEKIWGTFGRLIRKEANPKPHCVLLYFGPDHYQQFKRAILRYGGSSKGRRLRDKEEVIMRIIRLSTE